MSDTTVVLPKQVEAFVNAFQSIGGGDLSMQAGEKLSEAIKATMVQGKKSSVTITLGIGRTNDEMITIDGAVKATLPTPKITGAFFVDCQNYLPSRNRPNQTVLDFDKKGN